MKFLRSINNKLQKRIIVIKGNRRKTYNSLIDMPDNERMAYVLMAMNSCDDNNMTAEQFAMVHESMKEMMKTQAYNYGCR